MPTADFTENDVLAFFFREIWTIFQSGNPTATVLTDTPLRADVTFTPTHGLVTLEELFNNPQEGVQCSDGALLGDRSTFIEINIIAQSRKVATGINKRLLDFINIGKFQDTLITPPAGPVGYIYAQAPAWRTIRNRSNDETYGIQVDLTAYYFRTQP